MVLKWSSHVMNETIFFCKYLEIQTVYVVYYDLCILNAYIVIMALAAIKNKGML